MLDHFPLYTAKLVTKGHLSPLKQASKDETIA